MTLRLSPIGERIGFLWLLAWVVARLRRAGAFN
jgi:hypothetical protein